MFNKIKQFFQNIGANVGMVNNLNEITDHPLIIADQSDYDRIDKWLEYYSDIFDPVDYQNTNGERKQRPYMSINMAKKVSNELASLIFNEGVTISVPDEKSQAVLDNIFTNTGFYRVFGDYLESEFALGGLAIKPVWDTDSNSIDLVYVLAPNFYPSQYSTNGIDGGCMAYTDVTQESGTSITYTRLEFHTWNYNNDGTRTYHVHNELYRAETGQGIVGIQVPLNTFAKYENLLPDQDFPTVTSPLFVYMKPNGMNNKNLNSALGASIYANSIKTLKQISDAYDKFNWEIQMGQRKVTVPETMLEMPINKQRQSTTQNDPRFMPKFDENQNVYLAVPNDSDNPTINVISPDIRSDEFIASINHFLDTLEMELGFSGGTFSFNSAKSAITATQVVSENSATFKTRKYQLNNVADGLQSLVVAIFEMYNLNNPQTPLPVPDKNDVDVNFDDGVFQDKQAQLTYWLGIFNTGTISKETFLEKGVGMSPDEAQSEIEQTESEAPTPVGMSDLGGADQDVDDEGNGSDDSDGSDGSDD